MLIHNKRKGFLLRIVNAAIEVLYFPTRIFSVKPDLSTISPKKILLLRLDHIGDVVMTSPAFTAIRKRFPKAQICLLTDSAGSQLFSKDPRIDTLFTFNWPWAHQKKNNHFSLKKLSELFSLVRLIRKEKIDLLIDFRGDLRFVVLFGVLTRTKIRVSNSRCGNSSLLNFTSGYDVSIHEVERSRQVISCFGNISMTEKPQVFLQTEELSALKQKVHLETGAPYPNKLVVIAPYSSKDVKSWPTEYFREVIAHLCQIGFSVVIAGTADDRRDAELMVAGLNGPVYSFAGKTTIRELAALVSVADLVLGVDTGVLHIASCFDVPIIAIFGATRQVEFRPYSKNATILETNTCKCNQYLHERCDFPINGYAACLYGLHPDTVINTINDKSNIA